MIESKDLKKIEFFQDFTEEELEALNHVCSEKRFKAGALIFKEGAPADSLFVLKEGRVSIDVEVTGGKQVSVLTLSHFAEPFGWSAIVEPFMCTASARCMEDSVVFSIDGKALIDLIDNDYRLGFLVMRRVAKIMSGRVRKTRLQLINTLYG